MVFYIVGDVGILHLHRLGSNEVALHLTIQTMAHEFEHDVGIAVDAWALALTCKLLEYLIHIGHVEVATKTEVLSLPVVAAQERVHILYAALSRGAIAQVAHIELASKGELFLGILSVGKLLGCQVLEVGISLAENLCNGILALCPFTEHVFMSGLSTQFDTGHTCSFLATVVLLLHHQIELVECVHPCAVLLLVIR